MRTKRNGGFGLTLLAVLAVALIVNFVAGSGSAKPPSCQAHSTNCDQTADGYWVPFWYYGGLSRAQGVSGTGSGNVPSTTGTQPTAGQLKASGATSEEADDAESYASSEDSDGSSDDSGSDDGSDDDSGSDDSGGDDGGGDGGGD